MLRRLWSVVAAGLLVLTVAPHAGADTTSAPGAAAVWLLADPDAAAHDGFGFTTISAVTDARQRQAASEQACAAAEVRQARAQVLAVTRRLRATQLRLVDTRIAVMDVQRRVVAAARRTAEVTDDTRSASRLRVLRGRIGRLDEAVVQAERDLAAAQAQLDDVLAGRCAAAGGTT